jgi:hypothetical protein
MSKTPLGSHRPREVLEKIIARVRVQGPGIVAKLGINFALPYLIYVWAERPLGQVGALIAASAPSMLWSIIEFARKRRVDALSILALAGIALSLLAMLGGGGVKFLQLRERLVTAVIGLVFLGSAAIGRPLIYQLARARVRAGSPSQTQSFDGLRESPVFRHAMMVMTLVWGTALVIEAAIAAALVFVLPIPAYLIVSPVVGYGTLGAVTAWTYWYAYRRLRPLAASQVDASESAAPLKPRSRPEGLPADRAPSAASQRFAG